MSKIGNTLQKTNHRPKIVLTADETMMSKYRWGIFVGFSTSMPRGIIPDCFFFNVWSPPTPSENGRARYADFGLRIVEASLAEVFGEDEVAVVHPRDLEHMVGSRTEIIGIGGHDFLGINPPTSEFVDMLNTGPPYNRVKFFELMRKHVMREKTVVAGGKAAWQLADETIIKNNKSQSLKEKQISNPMFMLYHLVILNFCNSLCFLFIVGGVSIAEREKMVSTECGTGF